jgi:hypothetical protein
MGSPLKAGTAFGNVAIRPNDPSSAAPVNRPSQVLFASLIGTTIEFFDFYIYATAAVLVFPKLFFPRRTRPRPGSPRWRRLRLRF